MTVRKFGEEKEERSSGFYRKKKRKEKKAGLEGGGAIGIGIRSPPTRLKTGKNCKGSVAYFTRKKRNWKKIEREAKVHVQLMIPINKCTVYILFDFLLLSIELYITQKKRKIR